MAMLLQLLVNVRASGELQRALAEVGAGDNLRLQAAVAKDALTYPHLAPRPHQRLPASLAAKRRTFTADTTYRYRINGRGEISQPAYLAYEPRPPRSFARIVS